MAKARKAANRLEETAEVDNDTLLNNIKIIGSRTDKGASKSTAILQD
jgi:hypothetical protein